MTLNLHSTILSILLLHSLVTCQCELVCLSYVIPEAPGSSECRTVEYRMCIFVKITKNASFSHIFINKD